jgi:SRSO17 transposase
MVAAARSPSLRVLKPSRQAIMDGADRFAAYFEELTSVIGHVDRAAPLRDYCAGLLTAEGRKSVEPMAAVTAPAHVSGSIRSSCISSARESGRTRGCSPRCASW